MQNKFLRSLQAKQSLRPDMKNASCSRAINYWVGGHYQLSNVKDCFYPWTDPCVRVLERLKVRLV